MTKIRQWCGFSIAVCGMALILYGGYLQFFVEYSKTSAEFGRDHWQLYTFAIGFVFVGLLIANFNSTREDP